MINLRTLLETRSHGNIRTMKRTTKESIELYAIALPTIILIFIFMYIPLYGILISFQDYVPGSAFFSIETKWVGLKHFQNFIGSFYFSRILRNTITLSLLNLVMGFWVPIVFALLVNELRENRFKKFVQTASYMPHFISSVIVAGMVLSFVSSDGLLNQLLNLFGIPSSKAFNTDANAFPWIYTITNVWKSFGWSSILYLSTISSIDPSLYEAADLDGANRLKKIWYVTIPHMLPIIFIQLIFAIGNLLSSNRDMILLLYNPTTYETADVISTYVYREGLVNARYSYSAAVDLFMSIMGFVLVYGANWTARKTTDYALW